MFTNVLLIAAGFLGLIHLIWCKNNFARIIAIIQILAVGMIFIPNQTFLTVSMIVFMLSLGLIMIYSLFTASFKSKKRLILFSIAGLVFVNEFFDFNHYQYSNLIGLLMIIPLILYLSVLFKSNKGYKNEHGFLVITVIVALLEFINSLQNMFSI